MPRFFVGNFDFEATLGGGSSGWGTAALRRTVAELAPVWVAAAEDGDILWCPEPMDRAFFEELHAQGLPRLRPVSHVADVPAGIPLVPWGWTEETVRWGRSLGALIDAPPLDAVRTVNSRRFSYRLEQESGVGLPGAAIAESLPELLGAIDRFPSWAGGWVVKAEFSNSSRERLLHLGNRPFDREALARWSRRRLAMGQALFVEPWVERVDEVGVQLTIPRNGPPRLEGVTRLLVDHVGRYRGSEFTPALDNDPDWQEAVATALIVAGTIQPTGYFGPVGVDVMRYCDAAGNVRVRPLQDLNARWTMGRLSLGLRGLLRPGERGVWVHGIRAELLREQDSVANPKNRAIVTSPGAVGSRPARHRSIIRILSPS